MPITFTGRVVRPGESTYPSLVDIAVGTSRQPRFAGQGKRWFSVLDHHLFADELVKASIPNGVPILGGDDVEAIRRWRLAVLLHDAHESITADVPTDFKSLNLKELQSNMDRYIFGAFYPASYMTDPIARDAVKRIDRRALAAEAQVVGPPVSKEIILHAFGVTDELYDDVQLLESLLQHERSLGHQNDWLGIVPYVSLQQRHPGVREYLNRITELL